MTPFEMAKLHLLSGSLTRPWSESEYKILLSTDTIRFFYVENGFLVGRLIGPDAEILNVIVHPKYRRLGKARYLIDKFEKEAKEEGSSKCFLEVAESNSRANKLYQSLNYLSVGKRKNYYEFVDGRKDNASILAKEI
ncbi:MAG: GNAT family N-acetyltransferase [Paracoccaceae bacterium]|jgi:ribosomal-protein-alanine N-acetyltransferase|nr:GNAT family N-acetyltransferase [Paracoccaceae bacterium]MDG1677480.1 GNAT family N-acetyltransferase [Paracoccaceae bacterium]|tara:strand:+ start:1837 stop:2247 length:411 start_codon:yes stop_codon:yes gene_type:complete